MPELQFDAASHVYTYSGKRVPSVTQILHPLSQFSRWSDDWMAAASARGRAVHDATQFYDENDLDEESVEDEIKGYLKAWIKFRAEYDFTPALIERQVFHRQYGYAGTLDRCGNGLFTVGRKRVACSALIDIKSGVPDPTHGPQTAAYAAALNGFSPKIRAGVYLRANGTYEFKPFDDPADLSVFVAQLTIHKFKDRHGIK